MPTDIPAIRSLLPADSMPRAAASEQRPSVGTKGRAAEPAAVSGTSSLPVGGEKAVKAAAEQIESYLRRVNTNLEFRVDQAAGRVVVSVRERATGELIRQIPSEEALWVAARLGESGTSVLVKQES